MLVITSKQGMQLLAPPILGSVLFVMCLVVSRATGSLNRYTWKGLLAAAGLATYAVYLTLWQDEISRMWHSFPLVVVFGALLSLAFPASLFYWIWRVQVAAKAEQVPVLPDDIRKPSASTRLIRGFVLVWGLVNLGGLLIAIIYSFFRNP